MSKSMEKQLTVYRFGRFEMNPKEQLLRHDGKIVPLTPKIFETLLLLVQNNGRMLSKDEIMESVWADSFVEETNLTSNISRLRKILHSEGEQFIETYPKRGYRFYGEVEEIVTEREIILTRHVRTQIRQITEETDHEETAPEYVAHLAAVPNNLSCPQTPIVGREKEIAEIENLLGQPKTRLLTLTGVGGTGKTRLAQETALRMLPNFPDGVFFVALDAVRSPKLAVPKIARALGVKEAGGNSIIKMLKGFLQAKQMLLVADNFEQIVSAAPFLKELLDAAPQLKILVTSRVLLNIHPQREFRVPPLNLPEKIGQTSVEDLAEFESIKLFIERAKTNNLNFTINEANAPTVAAICQRLDGLPLAIELAAARIKILSPEQILTRLENCLKLLTGGARDLPARQQTMYGAIKWSYELLNSGEQILFRRLAVFAGGFDVGAAEAVCSSDEIDLLNCLTSLVENSLLIQKQTLEGESRFRLLEVVREYGLKQLRSEGELAEMRGRHHDFFLNLAKTAKLFLNGEEQQKWYSILETEHDNLRAALAWGFENDAEKTLHLARSIWQFWLVRGHLSEGSTCLREILSRTTDLLVPVRGEALVGAGFIERIRGDLDKAQEYCLQARTLGKNLGDANIIASALNGLGIVIAAKGDNIAARRFLEEGLQVSRAANNQRYIGLFLNNLGERAREREDYPEARRLYAESLAIQRELGNTRVVAIALGNLGRVSYLQNDFAAAREFYAESLEINRALGDLHSISLLLDGFAGLKAARQPERAAELLGAANALRRKIGSDFDKADAAFYEKVFQSIAANLENEILEKHLRVGGALNLEQAIFLVQDS